MGWKGFGLWACAQESEKKFSGNITPEEYWKKAIQEAHEAGISYWKVDWGEKINDVNFRRMLTETGKKSKTVSVVRMGAYVNDLFEERLSAKFSYGVKN